MALRQPLPEPARIDELESAAKTDFEANAVTTLRHDGPSRAFPGCTPAVIPNGSLLSPRTPRCCHPEPSAGTPNARRSCVRWGGGAFFANGGEGSAFLQRIPGTSGPRFPRPRVLANWKSFVAVMLYSPITDAA